MGKMELLQAVRQIKELQIFIKEMEKELDGVKKTVIGEMVSQNVSELVIDVFTIRYTSYITNRIDSETLKKENPEIYDYYTKTIEAKRFTVS